MSDTCRSCGADVQFVPSAKSGKPMILNVQPEKRVVVGELMLGMEPGAILVGYSHGDHMPTGARVVDTFVDHHATCPKAEQWKGRHR